MSGLVYAFSGEGKGKTSSALGVATRSLLLGEKVAWIAFYKQEKWGLAEARLRDKFPNLEMQFVGKGFRIIKPLHQSINKPLKVAKVGNKGNVVVDTASEEEHRLAAEQGIVSAREKLASKPFLLVLDEVLNAVSEGILEESEVIKLINSRGNTHIVLTGRGVTNKIIDVADLVTECKKIKHPYDLGKLAVKGLDF